MIEIVLVEDNKTIREGLSILLNATDGLKCTAKYNNCEDMLENLENTKPDLILMDIGLPGISGIEGVKKAREIFPDIVILMLSVYENHENIFQALCAGACGYLVKRTPPARLIEAIHEAVEGGSPMSAEIARKVVTFFHHNTKFIENSDETISDREKEILNGLSSGNSYKMLADSACISVDTVRYHIRNIYKKLHVHSQSEAVAKALRKGLI